MLLPVFYAGGTAPQGVDSYDLAEVLSTKGVRVSLLKEYPDQVRLEEQDVLLVAGARDPELPAFAHRIGMLNH